MIPKKQSHDDAPTIWATPADTAPTLPDIHQPGRTPRPPRRKNDPELARALDAAVEAGATRRKNRESWQGFETPPINPVEDAWRHSHWRATRNRIRGILVGSGSTSKQLEAWDNCGAGAIVQWSDEEQKHRISSCHCKSRHCQPCAAARATLIRLNLFSRLQQRPDGRYRFVTFTMKASDTPLADQYKRLVKCLSKIRGGKLWKRAVRGGAAVIETKRNNGHWHVHAHLIIEADWLPQADLSRLWLKITGDSFVVDVRQLHDAKQAAAYLAKYVTKSVDHSVWSEPSAAQEYICASRSLRVANTFGNWRGMKLLQKPKKTTDWTAVCSLASLVQRARDGERAAQILLDLLDKRRDVPGTG